MSVDKYFTHVSNLDDFPFLKTRFLDVNMRLYSTSDDYRQIIKGICEYMQRLACTEWKEYKKPHGISGANIGIPFNIIGVIRNRKLDNEYCQILINPKIISVSGEQVESLSNCGSLRLKQPIKIKRYKEIEFTYFDMDGKFHQEKADRKSGGFTIQHEVDHNLGILITDLIY